MLSFTSKKQQSDQVPPDPMLRIGYLGKVTFEPDFISLNANSREVSDFEQLFLGYYSQSYSGKLIGGNQFKGCQVYLTGGDNRQGLFVTVIPSRDSVGRLYPFMLFGRLSDPDYYFKCNCLFFLADDIIQNYGVVHGTHSNMNINSDYISFLSDEHLSGNSYQTCREVSQRSMELLTNFSTCQFRDQMVGEFKLDWPKILMVSLEQIYQYSNYGQVTKLRGIGLPIPRNNYRREVCVFWLQLIDSVIPRGGWRPDIVIPTNETCIYLLTRPLTESSLMECLETKLDSPSLLSFDEAIDETHQSGALGVENEVRKLTEALVGQSSMELVVALRKIFDSLKKLKTA